MERPKHSRYILPRPQFRRGLDCAQPVWYKSACRPFYWCKTESYEFLREIIDIELNNKNKHVLERRWEGQHTDWILFHGACYYGRLDVVEYMLSIPFLGINNNRNNIHQTLLLSAVWGNQIEVVRRLLQHPLINVNKRGNYGMFPLEIAVARGYIEIVKLLLAHPKILINQRTKQEVMTDLGRCLEFEADPYTYTALDIAAMKDATDSLQILLEKGAEQSNVLFHACNRGKEENVRYLLKQPQITKKEGCLIAAASNGHFWTVIELLKDDYYKDNKSEKGPPEYVVALDEALDITGYDSYSEYECPSNLYFNKKICAFELMNHHNKRLGRYVSEINAFARLPWLPHDVLRKIHTMARYVHPRLQDKEYFAKWKLATKYAPRKCIEWFEPEIEETGLPHFSRYAFIE